MILVKIAFRNLREHKIKTLIIGTLIALGIGFLVLGNSVMSSITRGMEASFVENYTGDLILRGATGEDVAFIGGFGEPAPVLTGYPELVARLEGRAGVRALTPLLTGAAGVNQDDELLTFALLWGIEPSTYFEVFPDSFVLTEGERLRDGEPGVLLAQEIVDDVREEHGLELNVGDTIQLSGQNDVTGTKIREVPIRGIGRFGNAVGLLERVSLVDATTLRTLAGLTAVRVERAEAAGPPAALSEEDLFGGGADALFDEPVVAETEAGGGAELDFDAILGDTSVRERFLALDNDAWHFLLLDLADDARPAAVAEELRADGGLGDEVLVEAWRWGAGPLADLAFGIRNILNIIILVVAVVAVIIIMNTLVISVTERIAEIGTVRAIGGQKAFVRGMITVEVLMITLVFGVVGMGLGSAAVGVLHLVGVPAGNLFLEILFGGAELRPVLSVASLFTSLGIVAVIGVVASLYPTSVALGIAPVRAMQRG